MKTKDECLIEIERDIMKKHDSAWTFLFFALILTCVSAFVIVYYTTYNGEINNCQKLAYGLAIIFNTLCLGYISAFAFYYYHDYQPLSEKILEDYQIIYAPVRIIYDKCHLIENKIFENNIPSEDYTKLFAEKIICGSSNKDSVQINPQVWNMIRLNSSLIEDCKNTMVLVRSDLNQITFISLSMSLDMYKQIAQKNWAVYDEDIPVVEYNDLLLVIKNFKTSLEEYHGLMLNMERYIYFDQYKYE